MRRALDKLYLFSGIAAACFIFAICAVVMAQVTLNLIDKLASFFTGSAIGLTIPSYSDFTGFFLAAASFLALAYTLREGGHIRVTLLLGSLSARVRWVFEFWSVGMAALLTAYLSFYTLRLVYESFHFGDKSSGIVPVPIWIPQSAMALGLVILTIALFDELFGLISGRQPSYEGKGENLLDEAKASQTGEKNNV